MTRNGLRRLPIIFSAFLVALLLASKADAIYLFHLRKDLAILIDETPDKIVGKQVVVTDKLIVLWPSVQQRPDQLKGATHVLFDTELFHCAIPEDRVETHLESIWEDARKGYAEITTKIEDVNEQQRTRKIQASEANEQRRKLYWELYRVWSNKPVVTIYGTVDRADFWGDVNGKDAGVATETISIVVDRVEKPRKRWYKSLDEH